MTVGLERICTGKVLLLWMGLLLLILAGVGVSPLRHVVVPLRIFQSPW